MDLRTAASVLRGSHNGPVIEKGSPDNSRLFQLVSKHLMPPPAFKSTVPDREVETIRRWIETGAHSSQAEATRFPEAARRQISRFEKEIQPIFNARCTACHSGETPQSGLDLTSLAAALKGGKHGPVISEGFSDKSILIRQLQSGVMPPAGAGGPIEKAELELIREWIDAGNFADYVAVEKPPRPRLHRGGSARGDGRGSAVLGVSQAARRPRAEGQQQGPRADAD